MHGLRSIHFYFFSEKFGELGTKDLPGGYYLEYPLKDQEFIRTAAYYDRDSLTRIWINLYNVLGDNSRAGLFLWESFREIIIANKGNINLKQQQKLLAKIILDMPQTGETLETIEYMGGDLLELAQKNKASSSCQPRQPFDMDYRVNLEQQRIIEFEKTLNH